jgi:ribosomal protein RSM22 (predicted rRNA methylase)
VPDLPDDLRTALATTLAGTAAAADGTDRLIGRYREDRPADEPILRDDADVAAYAGYRMPATFAAARAAFAAAAAAAPQFRPASQLDLGGGTGAAVWAAAATWGTLATATVWEQSPHAIAAGRALARHAAAPAVRSATWRVEDLRAGPAVPAADLVTVSYLLGELAPAVRDDLVSRIATGGGAVVIVEPGTPAGYARILAARDRLIGHGLRVLAPCPHDRACPLPPGRDWCHFAARVNRSALHRRLKGGVLGHEDEKFAYVATAPVAPREGACRVLRHPQQRKGMVSLRLCTPDDGVRDTVVSKRHGDAYRAARDVAWGDMWTPGSLEPGRIAGAPA